MVRWGPCMLCELWCQPCPLRNICLVVAVVEIIIAIPPMVLVSSYFQKGGNYIFEVNSEHTNGGEIFVEGELTKEIKRVMGREVTEDIKKRIDTLKTVVYLVGMTTIIGGLTLIAGLCLERFLRILTTIGCCINFSLIALHVFLTFGAIGSLTSIVNEISIYYEPFVKSIQRDPSDEVARRHIVEKFTIHKDNVLNAGTAIFVTIATSFAYFALCSLGYGLQLLPCLAPRKAPGDTDLEVGQSENDSTKMLNSGGKSNAGQESTPGGDSKPGKDGGESDAGNSKDSGNTG